MVCWVEAQTRQWHSFEQLNAWLSERCRTLWREIHHPEYKHFSGAEMLEQEQAQMMPMPTVFDGYVESQAKVSSTCLVSVQRNRYSVPCELAGQRVSIRLYAMYMNVVADDHGVAGPAHPPLPHPGDGQRFVSFCTQFHGRQDAYPSQRADTSGFAGGIAEYLHQLHH